MINQEEYELLKDLDDRLGWLARDVDGDLVVYEKKPEKSTRFWFDNGSMVNLGVIFDVGRLFQFIQWEDEEPYNIAELIEEYDKSQAYEIIESEEAEVKKDIEWLKGRFRGRKIFKPQNDREIGYNMAIDEFSEYVDQLDEPEVLLQEWVDKNVVHIRGLGDILKSEDVESLIYRNQEITYEDAIKVIAENIDTDEFSVGLYIEALNNNEKYEFLTDKWIEDNTSPVDDEGRLYVWKRDLQNLIVPKQELPEIPKYVADWIVDLKSKKIHLLDSIYDFTHGEDIHDYMRKHGDVLMRAWLDGFTVEKEQKYYAKIKGHELVNDSEDGYWNVDKKELYIDNIWHDNSGYKTTKLTKNDWNNLGINDDNADFVKV